MANGVQETARQSIVVMKNEIRKFFSGKRMMVFLLLMGAILFILTFAPYIVGSGLSKDVGQLTSNYLMMSSFIVLMGATLFASISIVSEYEERTALIIFTRPIRKISIFVGKMLASLAVTIGFVALYYIFTAVVSLIAAGGIDPDLWVSMGMAFIYAFATTGIAVLISTILKKASTATIITFVVLLAVLPALSLVLNMSMDASWMIDQAGGTITSCSEMYRDVTNASIQNIAMALQDPGQFFDMQQLMTLLSQNGFTGTFEQLVGIATQCLNTTQIGQYIESMTLSAPDLAYNIAVLAVWGLVSMAAAFVMFLRREF